MSSTTLPQHCQKPSYESIADLFQALRSHHATSVQDRLQLAETYWSNDLFLLRHKDLYFLRWMLEADFHDPKKTKSDSFIPPAHYPQFWTFLHQLVNSVQRQDLANLLAGPAAPLLLRHTISEWTELFKDPTISADVLASLDAIFPLTSQRLSFDLTIKLLHGILHGLDKIDSPISAQAEKMALLIIQGLQPTIQLASNSRKAINSLLETNLLTLILRIVTKFKSSSNIGGVILRMVCNVIFSLESTRKMQSAADGKIDWLEALCTVGMSDRSMATVVMESLPRFVSAFILELPSIQAQLFNFHRTNTAAHPSSGQTGTIDSIYLHATRTLVLAVVSSSHKMLSNLTSFVGLNVLPYSTASLKEIISFVKDSNLYDPGEPAHHEILNRIADHCVAHLSNPSTQTANPALEILVFLLSLDYTLIESRLSTILAKLVAPAYDQSSAAPVSRLLDGLFDWFSKAKQLPNLFKHSIDAIETQLSQCSLREITSGPLMARIFTERAHEEIRLSMSSAQMATMHELLSHRFRDALQAALQCPNISNPERSSKRRRLSVTQISPARNPPDECTNGGPSSKDAGLCMIISQFYVLFVMATSRSSLQSREWTSLSQQLAIFGAEITKMVIQPTLERWPSKGSKNRFRKWKNHQEQSILASTFRVLRVVIEVQSPQMPPELDLLADLADWIELLSQISKDGEARINPELSLELICLYLEFTSHTLFSLKPVNLDIPHTVYDTIFKILEGSVENDEHSTWNGSVACLALAELRCAMWHHLTTTYLSDFATLATPTQLSKFTRIAFKSSSQPRPSSTARRLDSISFVEASQTLLSWPTFYEAIRLRGPVMEELILSFKQIMPVSEDMDRASVRLTAEQLDGAHKLYTTVSCFPLSYLTKPARKFLLHWTLVWNHLLFSQTARQSTDTHLLELAAISSRSFLCRLLRDPMSSIKPSLMREAIGLVISSFSEDCCLLDHSGGPQTVTVTVVDEVIARLLKSTKAEEDSEAGLGLFEHLCSALAQRIGVVADGLAGTEAMRLQDRLLIVSLQAIADGLFSLVSRPADQHDEDQACFVQRIHKIIQPLLSNLQTKLVVVRVKGAGKTLSTGALKLCKVYLQLSRIGEQSNLRQCPIDLKRILPIDQRNDKMPEEQDDADQQALWLGSASVDVLEETLQLRRHQARSTARHWPTAFRVLVISHVRLRSRRASAAAADETYEEEIRRALVKSCKNSSRREFEAALVMLLEEIEISLGSDLIGKSPDGQKKDSDSQALIDVAVLMLLNGPPERDGTSTIDKRSEERWVDRLIRYLRKVQFENHQHREEDESEFLVWKTKLIDQVCVQKAHKLTRRSMLEVLETLIELSAQLTSDHQLLHDQLVSITSHLNHEHSRRALVAHFPLLVSLLAHLLVPGLELTGYSRLLADLSSTPTHAGAFSKHTPFLLVRLMSSVANHPSPSLAPGMMSLLGTMGKYERGSVGPLVLLNSAMGENLDADVEGAWRRTLKDWEKSRYKGTD